MKTPFRGLNTIDPLTTILYCNHGRMDFGLYET